jgi:hypothetical protein
MGTSDTPSKVNAPSQAGQPQSKPQQNSSAGQQSPGQHKPRDPHATLGDRGGRSARSSDDKIGSIGKGEDAMDDDESDPESDKSRAGSDRARSNGERTQPR